VRTVFRQYCARLRRREIPTADLCVSMPLNKTPDKYAQSERKEEAYEVYLAAGNAEWRQGHRIRFYQTRLGKKLLQHDAADYDSDFYIDRLRSTALQRLEKAFSPADLQVLFSEFDGLFDPPLDEIRPLRVTYEEPILWETKAEATPETE
jgi:DNA polymerase elongation subunit (family B)